MKNKILIIVVFLSVVLFSCGSSKQGTTDFAEYQQMLERVQALEFSIDNQWANPVKYSTVNIINNPNFIRFKRDSVEVFLPYFGERHSGGGYGTGNGSIQYKGPLENLSIEERSGKNQILLSFEGNDDNENLDFQIVIFRNGKTRTSVTSSERDSIDYEGMVQKQTNNG